MLADFRYAGGGRGGRWYFFYLLLIFKSTSADVISGEAILVLLAPLRRLRRLKPISPGAFFIRVLIGNEL